MHKKIFLFMLAGSFCALTHANPTHTSTTEPTKRLSSETQLNQPSAITTQRQKHHTTTPINDCNHNGVEDLDEFWPPDCYGTLTTDNDSNGS